MSKIGVAGGFGFLGRHVTMELLSKGYDAIPFSRRSGVDIRNMDATGKFLDDTGVDTVINCATVAGGIAYNKVDPYGVFQNNLEIGCNLNRICHDSDVIRGLVHIFPNCVYPGRMTLFKEEEWLDGPPHDSVMVTAMPRRAVWAHSQALKKDGKYINYHYYVLPNMYGPHDHMDPVQSHALGALICKVVEAYRDGKDEVTVWGTGSPIREWGHVADMAKDIIHTMEYYSCVSNVFINLGCGEGYTIGFIAEVIKDAVGWRGEFIYDHDRDDGAPEKIMCVDQQRRINHGTPAYDILSGIEETVEWYMNQ